MAFVPVGDSELRKRALFQNALLEDAQRQIQSGFSSLADIDREKRRQALLEQESINRANADEARRNEEFNREMRKEEKEAEATAYNRKVKDRELELKEKELGFKREGARKPKVSTFEQPQGQKVPAGQATTLGEAEAAIKNISDLNNLIGSSSVPTGRILGRGSQLLGAFEVGDVGTEAAQLQNAADSSAQVIGTYLEGGKLTAEDYERYRKLVPSLNESQETRQKKTENLIKLIENKKQGQISGLKQFGFNVGQPQQAPQQTPQMSRLEYLRAKKAGQI